MLAGGLAGFAFAAQASTLRFDYYVLALTLAPAFCEHQPERTSRLAQCRGLDAAAFKAMPLTVHGLWPSRRDRAHPEFCAGRRPQGGFCAIAPLRLAPEVRDRLGQVMPGTADCLDRYQWVKHGSCSGLAPEVYFSASAALAERVNRALGADIARNMGREVGLDTLRNALARNDPQLLDAVVFDCRTPKTPHPAKRRPMLMEVRVIFARDPATGKPGKPLDYRQAGHRHFNSGCPAGRAWIDSPLD